MKKVLVTGSTQGIGKAIAMGLVEDGYEVTVHCSKDLAKAESIRKEIGAAHAVTADLGDRKQVETLKDKTGDVDILILNASVQIKQNWMEIGDAELQKQLDVNLISTLKLMQTYYPHMKSQQYGRIITIGSVNEFRNHPELTLYSATKCAVSSMVKNIAKQVAGEGITVNNIAPGAIATPRNQDVLDDPEKKKAVEKAIPAGRFGEARDCVGIVRLLCSDAGSYITGTDMVVDGGMKL